MQPRCVCRNVVFLHVFFKYVVAAIFLLSIIIGRGNFIPPTVPKLHNKTEVDIDRGWNFWWCSAEKTVATRSDLDSRYSQSISQLRSRYSQSLFAALSSGITEVHSHADSDLPPKERLWHNLAPIRSASATDTRHGYLLSIGKTAWFWHNVYLVWLGCKVQTRMQIRGLAQYQGEVHTQLLVTCHTRVNHAVATLHGIIQFTTSNAQCGGGSFQKWGN